MIARLFGCVLVAGFASAVSAAAPDPALAQAHTALQRLPLRFEANQGQWSRGVRYAARAGGYTLLLDNRGPSLAVPGASPVPLKLAGSSAAAQIEALDPLPTRTDYRIGNRPQNWHTGVANYARVRYRSVYPGIDVVYYGNASQLEYDFLLAPGADPRHIRFDLSAAGHIAITAEGDLSIEIGGHRILQRKPFVYQAAADGARRAIAGDYTLLNSHTAALRLGDYDRTRPLVVDPVIDYLTYFGGSGTDQITAVKLTSRGRLYIAGATDTGEMPAVGNAYNTANTGSSDVFLAIVDTTQSGYPLLYLGYIGGTSTDVPLGIDVDSAGFVYLCGSTISDDFPLGGTNIQSARTGTYTTGFVVKIDPSSSGTDGLWWGTYLGGTGATSINGIVSVPDGTIDVIGTTRAADFPTTSSGYATSLYGPQDAVLCQMDPNSGTLLYSTFLGGELNDDGVSIALGTDNRVYFAITTNGTLFPAAGYQYQPTFHGVTDVVVGVMDFSKNITDSLIWDSYFGGSDTDEVRRLVLDSRGYAVITGYTLSSDFPVSSDAAQRTYSGNGDAFVSVLNLSDPSKFLVYSSYLGGSDADVAYGVTEDAAGNLYVVGYTLSKDFPVTPDAPQTAWANGVDMFIAKVQPGVPGKSGIQFATYLGGSSIYVANNVAVDSDGTLYVAGYGAIGLPSSPNASQTVGYGGGVSDGFLLVMKQAGAASSTGAHRIRHSDPADAARP